MKKKDLFLGGGILFAACVLFLVMNLMQYVQAKESGQKEIQEKQDCDQGGWRSLRKICFG